MMTFDLDNDGAGRERPKNGDNASQVNMENCLIYVKRIWPDDPEDIQIMRAEAVYAISKVFFTEIIPSVIQKNLTPSLN